MLTHDMASSDPYPKHSLPAAPETRYPRVKYREPTLPLSHYASTDTRSTLRNKNYHGTLGTLNFDGSVSDRPAPRMGAHVQDMGETIFTGGHTRDLRGPVRYGPGLQSSLYSDSAENMERKRALQQELAEYERIQLRERVAKKEAERRNEIESAKTLSWPFQNSHKTISLPVSENRERFAMHKIEEYSNDLVTGDHARKPHHHHQNAPSPTPPPIQHQQTYSQPTRSEYNPVPATFNPISHAPNPSKPIEARRRKFQIDDERESVYPLGIKVPDQPIQRPPPEPDMFNRFNTEYRAPEKISDPGTNFFGRRRVLDMDDTSDRVKLDEQAKRLHRLQEEDLKRRREENVVTQMRDLEQGKQFATNYPWDWGNTVKKDPRHRSTDISRKTEPMDRDKAMQYHADLDRIMEEKREAGRRERERGRCEGEGSGFWDKFGAYSYPRNTQ